VANRAAEYASAFDARAEAKLAALLHDLGKYGDLFQKRLKGEEHGIDHWSAGACAALTRYKLHGIASALAIQGHHIGLQKAEPDSLRELDIKRLTQRHPLELRLSEPNLEVLLQRLNADGLDLPEVCSSLYDYNTRESMSAAAMLDVRMFFSALVDADFIETEAHFNAAPDGSKGHREPGPPLQAHQALPPLLSYLDELAANSSASPEVNRLRSDLLAACLEAATSAQSIFTLTAPTGAGKTLSMLAFALGHALKHGLRRIVTVIPYLSIIEQTVGEYRKVFTPHFQAKYLDQYILEDHSLAGTRGADQKGKGERDTESEAEQKPRLLAENWDAPIIATTSVQFFESLFANRPSACRKLHRLAKSVILFDEVQTFPAQLAVPSLATLSRLVERYGATVVFATATQPAFGHLDQFVRKYCVRGWQPQEIAKPQLRLFERARRTQVAWPKLDEKTSWAQLAEQLSKHDQALCVVNLKRHALLLFDELKKLQLDGLFHLSTNMCPAHRQVVLDTVRERLQRGKPCRLVSTQCVEAGVDVDFPVAFRALGPLDAIAQAAGRCNRNGRSAIGTVHVFVPEGEDYPDGTYRQAASLTRILLRQLSPRDMDIHNPALFDRYYREFYDLAQPQKRKEELQDAIKRQDFETVAKEYRLIENDAINVLVPYDREVFRELCSEVRETGLRRTWFIRARPHVIGLFRPKRDEVVSRWLEAVRLGRGVLSEEWFIYMNEEHYDPDKGLVPPASLECLIA
jgi:CRISPR-associated helicase Cas3/CRISPR-associated endonuclease Cas3-HD